LKDNLQNHWPVLIKDKDRLKNFHKLEKTMSYDNEMQCRILKEKNQPNKSVVYLTLLY
jgi:hypothetical protein